MLPPQPTGPPKFSVLHRPPLLLGAWTPPREVGLENLLGPQLRALNSRTERAEAEAATRKGGCSARNSGVCTLEPALPPSRRGTNFPSTHLSPRGGGAAGCPRRRRCRRRSLRPAPAGAAPSTASPAASSPPEPPPSCRCRLPPAPASLAAVRWCPPVPAALPRCSCRVRFRSRRRRRRPHPPPPLPSAAPLARRQQQHSLARTRSGSGAHPGTARDVTEGGRWLVHIHETRTSARGCALPRLAAPAPNFPQPSPYAARSRDPAQSGTGAGG